MIGNHDICCLRILKVTESEISACCYSLGSVAVYEFNLFSNSFALFNELADFVICETRPFSPFIDFFAILNL